MKEYKVGQIVTIKGTKTRVTKSNGSCEGCIGQKIEGVRLCHTCECRNSHRVDKNDIIFKPIDSTPTPKDVNNALGASNQSEFPLPPENMRVWIRGNRERGEEVIKALTDLGAKNIINQSGDQEEFVYFITIKGLIDIVSVGSDEASWVSILYKEINLPWKPKDKELVWCWNASIPYGKCLRFYDAKNNCTFDTLNGSRDCSEFYYYAPYKGEWPDWAKEAQKKLED